MPQRSRSARQPARLINSTTAIATTTFVTAARECARADRRRPAAASLLFHVAARAACADDAPMMILRSSPPSPFGRKVRIALSLLGFDHDVRVEGADTGNPQDTLREQNPLGKIPVLVVEDGSAFYDSRVILEYLDERAGGGKIIPRDAGARLAALRLQALCDGILDASILTIYEARWRAAEKHERNGSNIRPTR